MICEDGAVACTRNTFNLTSRTNNAGIANAYFLIF